jgi:late competence protein required for DNA uptake (superfamily II DNA/RNA helicase)
MGVERAGSHVFIHCGRKGRVDDVREDKIKVLVSTTTHGQGVNLPIKTAIIFRGTHSVDKPTLIVVEEQIMEDLDEKFPWFALPHGLRQSMCSACKYAP